MDANQTPTGNPPSTRCDSCGKEFDPEFKFCPFCGRVTASADDEARRAAVREDKTAFAADAAGGAPADKAGADEKNISPEARRALAEFDRQFEELKQKHENSLTKKKPALGFNSNFSLIMAIVGGALLLFLFFMVYHVMQMGKAAVH
jgi:hypothetical protein